jgi:subtilisin family serine protease
VVPLPSAQAAGFDEVATGVTWGLEATGVMGSRWSGQGVKVAVLDTGLDLAHPDFAGRVIHSESLVPAPGGGMLPPQNIPRHGTHCIGTACGPRDPGIAPRYGIAFEAEIYVGKVLNNRVTPPGASGLDGWILAGINWAIRQGCRVISLSISGPQSQSFAAYEIAAKRALQTTAIIAAVGNDSNRRLGIVRPVGSPASCLSILGVGAIDPHMQVKSPISPTREGPWAAAWSTSPAPVVATGKIS